MRSRALAPAAALLLAACGTSPATPRPCAAATDCLAGSFCREGHCAESTPPVAVVAPPAGTLLSHAHLLFDGAGSRDADVADGDRVVAWSWSARAVSAPCEPVHPTGSTAGYDLVAGCAGTFEVLLTVADTTGRASEPTRVLAVLEPSPTPPSAAVAGPASLAHRCQGSPLLCTTSGPAGEATFGLQVAAEHPVTGSFTYAWSAVPPPGLAGPPPRVTFDPPDAASPAVRIETDGTAIAGEYQLRVVATDADGLAAVAVHRLAVENQTPVVIGGGSVLVGHSFDPAASRFLASGAVQAQVADPDGDPVSGSFSSLQEGAGAATLELAARGTIADFSIAAPYLAPEDALFFIGGAGLRRTIRFTATDANGGTGEVAWDVTVSNRPPRRVTRVDAASADHTFDEGSLSYLASAPVSAYLDDDGDPIVQRAPTGSAICPSIEPVPGSGSPILRCRHVYPGRPDVQAIARTHLVTVALGDPFQAVDPTAFAFTVLNRAPRLRSEVSIPLSCTPSVPTLCCQRGPPPDRLCLAEAFDSLPASISVPPPVEDADGDPLVLSFTPSAKASASPATMSCTPATCPPVTLSVAAFSRSCTDTSIAASVSDGLDGASGRLALSSCLY